MIGQQYIDYTLGEKKSPCCGAEMVRCKTNYAYQCRECKDYVCITCGSNVGMTWAQMSCDACNRKAQEERDRQEFERKEHEWIRLRALVDFFRATIAGDEEGQRSAYNRVAEAEAPLMESGWLSAQSSASAREAMP